MMKKIIFLLIFCGCIHTSKSQCNLLYHWEDTSLVGSWAYNNTYNEIWGVEVNNHEFAIIGSTEGTHIFDVTNPSVSYEAAFIPAPYVGGGVIHRDYHDYKGYLYIVCDEGNTSTLQIVDISNLPNSASIVYDTNALFTKSHNIFIDTASSKLYACAVKHTNPNNFASAMEVYSLVDPLNPTLLYIYNDVGHVHDAYVRNDTAYLNCGGDGFRIVDFSLLNLPSPPSIPYVELASLTSYPDAGYNHSGWLNDNGTIYAMQDENHGYDIKILDISDFNNINVLATFNSGIDPNSMAHNGIIKGDYLYVAYYHDGLRIFDISNPSNPIQVCYYDTYLPTDHVSYRGAWGIYPYLTSGNILVSDMQSGLYLFSCTPISTNTMNIDQNSFIYPNPATGSITINIPEASSIKLYDMVGKLILQKDISERKKIETSLIYSGLYFYQIINKRKIINSGKIILQ